MRSARLGEQFTPLISALLSITLASACASAFFTVVSFQLASVSTAQSVSA
jgi:hypothetical protein